MNMSALYMSANELWRNAYSYVEQRGKQLESRDGGCREVIGWSGKLRSIDYPLATVRGASPTYAAAEMLWYLSGSNDVRPMEAYAPQYRRFAQPSTDTAHGAYGARWKNSVAFRNAISKSKNDDTTRQANQLDMVIDLLRKNPNTRQAVLTMWDAGDLVAAHQGGCNDIPCTVSIQFLLRDQLLHAVTYMRSNDVWLGLPYDIFTFTTLQRLIALSLNVETGSYTHNVGSLHLYDRNRDKALEAHHHGPNENYWFAPDKVGDIDAAIALEERVRTGEKLDDLSALYAIGNGSLAYELVARCLTKWGVVNKACTDLMLSP